MRIGSWIGIVDAERNRRTLEKPANQRPWFRDGASSKSMKRVPKTVANVMKHVIIWDPKSMQNRASAAEGFG